MEAGHGRVVQILSGDARARLRIDRDQAAAAQAEPNEAAEGRRAAHGRRERRVKLALVPPVCCKHLR